VQVPAAEQFLQEVTAHDTQVVPDRMYPLMHDVQEAVLLAKHPAHPAVQGEQGS
jgi:hypothetical protein